jgi:dolichol-phosphate mannosyltransferase
MIPPRAEQLCYRTGVAIARPLIITPTYDERDNLAEFVAGVRAAAPAADVLVVDDASPDGTGELAEELRAADPKVFVLHRKGKLGLGSAYLEGFRWGLDRGYDCMVEMDADHSHDPGYLPRFFAELDAGADVVVGSRNVAGGGVRGWGLGRKILSRGGSLYARAILGLGVHDLTTGYKAFRRQVLERIDLDRVQSNGYAFQVEMTYRAVLLGFRVAEVPIVFVDRRVGQSKMSRRIVAEAVTMVWKLRLDALRGVI